MKLATKMIIGFLVIALLGGVVSVIGIFNMQSMVEADKILYEENVLGLNFAGNAAIYYQRIRFNAVKLIAQNDSAVQEDCINKIYDYIDSVEEYLRLYEEGIITEEDRRQFDELTPQWDSYKALIIETVEHVQAGETAEAEEIIFSKIGSIGDAIQQSFDKMFSYNSEGAEVRYQDNAELASTSLTLMLVLVVAAILVSIILAVLIARSISRPVAQMVEVADKLAQGDIEVNIDTKAKAEIGALAKSFSHVVEDIKEQAAIMEKIAQGDLNVEVKEKSEKDVLNIALKKVIRTLNQVNEEINTLSAAATNGDLNIRGNVEQFQGDYKKILEGINQTLEETIRPVKEATTILAKIAEGDLRTGMEGDYKGDHAILKNALNKTLAAFNETLANINIASDQVAVSAQQVSDSSMALSQGATEQASSIEQLTASLEEIATQTKQNAVYADEANTAGKAVKDSAVNGKKQMQQMLQAMEEINESSNSIAKIIKVIDEIAFQTNILSLNAAVEAARAGAHGKGFSVVAEEVRNLAARSANAAQETTDLIEGSMRKVEAGTKIAEQTAEAFEEIVEGIEKVANLVSEIAVASNEQASAIEQINSGVTQISDVVQTNSATSEESAAASEELASQAQLLKEQVAAFKLKNQHGGSAARGAEEQTNKLINQKQVKEAHPVEQTIILSDSKFGKY